MVVVLADELFCCVVRRMLPFSVVRMQKSIEMLAL
jgi:hypothetical protein